MWLLLVTAFVASQFFVSSASAAASQLFTDYLAQQIYNDCQGIEINVKAGHLLTNNDNPLTLITKDQVTLENIKQVTEIIGNREPYTNSSHGCKLQSGAVSPTKSGNGCAILRCGNHVLDINGESYYWDNIRVDVPRQEFKAILGDNFELKGNQVQVSTGDNSTNTQNMDNTTIQIFSRETLIGSFFGVLATYITQALSKLITRRRFKGRTK